MAEPPEGQQQQQQRSEVTQSTDQEDGQVVQQIRITSHGKMKNWVTYSLDYLQKHERNAITLHTLPVQRGKDPQPPKETAGHKPATCTTTVPRLISVVEIVKREYMATLEKNRSPRLVGLYQYNEIGSLEDLGGSDVKDSKKDEGAEDIVRMLSGKNYVQQKQTPYMRVTLSQSEMPELVQRGATYQPPMKRKLSKSAKQRAKKRQRRSENVERSASVAPADDIAITT